MLRKACAAVLLVLMSACPVFSQNWAREMFETTSHDFGSVARGSKAEFRFKLNNIYIEDVRISSVRSSCGCTIPSIEKQTLKTYEEGAIVAKFNTPAFRGRKGATLTVTFEKPFWAQVQLHVKGFIRGDVVLEPGSVEIGQVRHGEPVERKVRVAYAGRSDWGIQDIQSANPHISAKAVEAGRQNGMVAYDLLVRLDKEAPTGYIRDHIMLITNDINQKQIPVAVEGRVLSRLQVSPSTLFMGVMKPGQKVTKQLVVKSDRPFRILAIESNAKGFKVDPKNLNKSKLTHVVPITFKAGDNPEKIAQTIQIKTDMDNTSSKLPAYAVVAAE